jgi:glycosyltransferase involved in cell wall biosynthesis
MTSRLHFDPATPGNLSRVPTSFVFSGWYADAHGRAARALRLRLGRRLLSCPPVVRTDLPPPVEPGAGFHLTLKTGTGLKLILIEALGADGQWRTVGRRLVWVTRTGGGANGASAAYRSGLDGLYQACLGVRLAHTEETCELTWVIPDFNAPGGVGGGGGHLNLFRMVQNLEALGLRRQQFLIVGPHTQKSGADATALARRCFFPTEAPIWLPHEPLPRTKAWMASCWHTAYFVRERAPEEKKFYFSQDYEPLFYPAGSNSALVEQTYRFGFKLITAGPWLRGLIERDFGADAVHYGFSYDKDIYRPPAPPSSGDARFDFDILFYARPHTERRMFDLGVEAIRHAISTSGRPLRVAFAGGCLPPESAPFPFASLGVLSLRQLAALYGRVRCALVLSATNASLLPYELMACGCPLVTNDGPSNAWLFPDGYGGLAPAEPAALGSRLAAIVSTPALRDQLSADGLRLVAGTDWMAGARDVLAFLRRHGVP